MGLFILLGVFGEQELLLLVIVVILLMVFGNKFPRIVKTIGKNVQYLHSTKKKLKDDIFNIKNLLK